MDHLSFTFVSPEGLASFGQDLASDAWGAIDTKPWEGPNQTAVKPIGDAPVVVGYKLRLTWGIASLVDAIEGKGSAKECDKVWDSCQKQLRALIAAAAASSDPKKRDAAGRLQKSLLMGAGEQQTKLKFQKEVDFGRNQATLVAQGQGAADVALLGLSGMMDEIAKATDALALAIGYGVSAGRPFERLQAVTSACAASFTAIAEQLGWDIEHAQPGSDRERAISMRAPMEKLVARYPAPKDSPAAMPPGGGTAPGAKPAAPGGGTAPSGTGTGGDK